MDSTESIREEGGEATKAILTILERSESGDASLIESIVIHTAIASLGVESKVFSKKEEEEEMPEPKLAVMNTLHNYQRLVTQLKKYSINLPTTEVRDVLSWKNSWISLVCYFVFVVICCNLHLVPYIPSAIFLCYLLYGYYVNKKKQVEVFVEGGKAKTKSTQPSKSGSKPAKNISKQLQKIQNGIGKLADALEKIEKLWHKIDWTDEKGTRKTIYLTTCSFGVIFIVSLIPARILFLLIGTQIFFAKCPIVVGMRRALKPRLVKAYKQIISKSKAPVSTPGNSSTVQDVTKGDEALSKISNLEEDEKQEREREEKGKIATITFDTFENQRWWPFLGWSKFLLPSERGPWSSESPTRREFTPMESFLVPNDTWKKGSWHIDTHSKLVDSDGWEYGSHNWVFGLPFPGFFSLTRRRRWICLARQISRR